MILDLRKKLEEKKRDRVYDLARSLAMITRMTDVNQAVLWAQDHVPEQLYPQVRTLAQEILDEASARRDT